MNYSDAVQYLYDNLPVFQNTGKKAFNKSLDKTLLLLDKLGSPEHDFKSVHIGGTNGKGTTAHMLAAVFQSSGYKTGLYTSPHLKEFTERIRINGKQVERNYVIDFVNTHRDLLETIKPSFFEVTVAMAFDYFSAHQVDIAIIEVGMGGRLDSTNVIHPEVSVITSLSLDHQQYLGDTIPLIAMEKAGIIKENTPVVVGNCPDEANEVFRLESARLGAPLFFVSNIEFMEFTTDLKGNYIRDNIKCVLKTVDLLKDTFDKLNERTTREGLLNVGALTGLKGRWQQLSDKPLTICDTGHNTEAFVKIIEQINQMQFENLWIVLGMVKEKDCDSVLRLLPKNAHYVWTRPSVMRGLDPAVLKMKARTFGLKGVVKNDVNKAIEYSKARAGEGDLIFIGGSTFVVADINDL